MARIRTRTSGRNRGQKYPVGNPSNDIPLFGTGCTLCSPVRTIAPAGIPRQEAERLMREHERTVHPEYLPMLEQMDREPLDDD